MKKFAKLLICLLLCCTFALSGCSLVQRNTERYLNKTVATVGNSITITMQDLLGEYNNYGYQYVEMYGYTTEKAVNKVLEDLINKRIVLEEAKKHILIDDITKQVYFLTFDKDGNEIGRRLIYNKNVWQNDVLSKAYESMNAAIAEKEEVVRKELNIEKEESNSTEEKAAEFAPYKPYEKTVKYENGEWSIDYGELEKAQQPIGDFIQKDTGNKEVSEIAYKRYIKGLLSYEKTMGNVVTEQQALQNEILRLSNIHEENKYIEVFKEQFEKTQLINGQFNSRIVDYYKRLVLASNEKYQMLGEEGYKKYCEDMQSEFGSVYYHPYGEKFVKVSHVLVKLSDDQLAEIKVLDGKLSTGVISQQERDEEYQKVLDKTVVKARDNDGKDTDVTKTVAEVYAEINAELDKYNTLEEKAIAFNKFIYKYGQDTGVINAENYYVVNLDTEIEDKMVKNFADKSRELYNQNNNGGNLSEPVFVESSNYSGYHIIFNVGGVNNNLNIEQVEALTGEYAANLYNQKIMLGTDKTVYDLIFEKLTRNDYTNYEQSIINTAKNNYQIVIYASRLTSLY